MLPPENEGGRCKLPVPSPGDVFFDIEGDPYAFGQGIEYLLGWATSDGGTLSYGRERGLSRAEEKRAFEEFVSMVSKRLVSWPDLHIYHYNHYEPDALKRLALRHGT